MFLKKTKTKTKTKKKNKQTKRKKKQKNYDQKQISQYFPVLYRFDVYGAIVTSHEILFGV